MVTFVTAKDIEEAEDLARRKATTRSLFDAAMWAKFFDISVYEIEYRDGDISRITEREIY